MPSVPRKLSEANIYHIVSRGDSHQILFKDDEDRSAYLAALTEKLAKFDSALLAWCLMDNYIHLLVQADLSDLSHIMQQIHSSYALYFNKRYSRKGNLFQGKFKSEPVDTDDYLKTVVRYIHQTPERTGVADTQNYAWSSYKEYLGAPAYTQCDFVLSVFGDKKAFAEFHEVIDLSAKCLGCNSSRKYLDDATALRIAQAVIAPLDLEEIQELPRDQRNEALQKLKETNLSMRQIERFTGVSKGVIQRV